jgi:hypothetical protein
VNVYVRALAEMAAQLALDVRGMGVRLVERDVARHTQVHLYGYATADATCAQMVHSAHLGLALHNLCYLPLLCVGQTLLEQFVKRTTHEHDSRAYDEDAHHNGGYRVEHSPFLSEEDGSTDAYSRAY